MTKDELRKEIRAQIPHWTQEEYFRASSEVIHSLIAHPKWKDLKAVMLYSSLPSEPYTHELIQALSRQGTQVLLPKVLNGTEMEFRLYEGQDKVSTGPFGIIEPTTPKVTEFEDVNLIVIPGMAFDRQGHRMGKGKGYYDRFLSALPHHIYKLGICFNYQIRESIPHDEYDIPMDEVIC